MRKYACGEPGFLKYRKHLYFAKTLLYLGIGLDIYSLGLLLNYASPRNIFSVLAMLMILPGAKSLVEGIVLFPYQPVDREYYEEAAAAAGPEAALFADAVITSAEKVMNLFILVENKGHILGLAGRPGQDTAYIESYLKKGVQAIDSACRVKIHASRAAFLRELKKWEPGKLTEEAEKEVLSYLTSLMVK